MSIVRTTKCIDWRSKQEPPLSRRSYPFRRTFVQGVLQKGTRRYSMCHRASVKTYVQKVLTPLLLLAAARGGVFLFLG